VVRPHLFVRRNFNTFEGGAAIAPAASRLISRDPGVGGSRNSGALGGRRGWSKRFATTERSEASWSRLT